LHGNASSIEGKSYSVAFGGRQTLTLPVGQFVTSDPIALPIPEQSDVTISIDLPPQKLRTLTIHDLSSATTYVATGNQVDSKRLCNAAEIKHWYLIKDLQVSASDRAGAVVVMGDSITDGARSTPDSNHRWPDILAARFSAERHLQAVSVMNEGISGNRLLNENTGPSALDRLKRDVLDAPGAKWVIVSEGINDIRIAQQPKSPSDSITVQQMISAYKLLIERCHAKGLKIYGATLTPDLGSRYANQTEANMRDAINIFIRTPGNFDGVIDFDRALDDPANPGHLRPDFDSGDHLHPNDKGYEVMGKSIPLSLFD
jgi:lysophospholipase L1-like esterase